jgi:hypothetical protein
LRTGVAVADSDVSILYWQGITPMAHLVEQIAYVGATPWHGLGSRLSPKQPIEIWQREAGMDWQIQDSPVHFKADTTGHLGTIYSFPEQKVLYRSDTKAPLSSKAAGTPNIIHWIH